MKDFSIKEALSFGWDAFTSRVGFFIVLLLLFGVLTAIPQLLIKHTEFVGLRITLVIINQLFQYFLTVGLVKIGIKVVDGSDVKIGDLFSGGPVFVTYVLGAILFSLIVLAGFVLLVVPGIALSVMLQYYSYFIIDKNMGPVEAIKASAALTKGVRWKLFGFLLALGLINIVGALLLVVGLFATVPVSLVAVAFVYRKLLPQTQFALTA
ncbi:MAG: hypothetical protein DM484_16990 [Candidatus Methylumidiphilus alinenensis]|uniref:DUF7847 domain-containing protein n=1 Tax=Candidatus Methylumidiphilus alinenensis TaxID=2202197 RepID=A0A2W4SU75_9GAMM|nr:MAG: hypothetical protein DM484_16990 [Candidatus Methylumidiphilus alinenensis]